MDPDATSSASSYEGNVLGSLSPAYYEVKLSPNITGDTVRSNQTRLVSWRVLPLRVEISSIRGAKPATSSSQVFVRENPQQEALLHGVSKPILRPKAIDSP